VVSRLDLTEPIVQSVLIAAAAGTQREADPGRLPLDEPVDDPPQSWRLGALLQLSEAAGDDDAGPQPLALQQLLLKGMLHPATELPTVRVRLEASVNKVLDGIPCPAASCSTQAPSCIYIWRCASGVAWL